MGNSDDVLGGENLNVFVSWLTISFTALVGVLNFLTNDFIWAFFALFTALIAALPAILCKDRYAVVPWEILIVATLPYVGLLFDFYSPAMANITMAGLAIIAGIELHMFTEVEMTSRFMVVFVIITSAAIAGLAETLQYFSDQFLGTTFVAGSSQMMWDLIFASAAGILGGLLLEIYLRDYRPTVHIDDENGGDL